MVGNFLDFIISAPSEEIKVGAYEPCSLFCLSQKSLICAGKMSYLTQLTAEKAS